MLNYTRTNRTKLTDTDVNKRVFGKETFRFERFRLGVNIGIAVNY
jgi:hypothetical protein